MKEKERNFKQRFHVIEIAAANLESGGLCTLQAESMSKLGSAHLPTSTSKPTIIMTIMLKSSQG